MATRPITSFIEQYLGKFPHFVLCMVLDWVLTISFFIDGFLSFFTTEFARFFGLDIPCWLCAKMNNVMAQKNPKFYYNHSMCETHKKDVSYLVFCHNHKKISDIRKMCEGCLLSFATQKESDCDTYKSLVGVLNRNLEVEKSSTQMCSCCEEPLKLKSSISKFKNSGPFVMSKYEESCDLDSPQIMYAEKDSELPKNEDDNNLKNQNIKLKEVLKGTSLPPLAKSGVESPKTPSLPWGNRILGVPLTDSPYTSPRWSSRESRRSSLDKTEIASVSTDGDYQNEEDSAVLNKLKKQVRLDRKSVMALCTELDEERSASAVAANNAMAMITRLQEEKAALQMDTSQYQRMMEDQIEYDEEVLQETNDLLIKLEEEVKTLDTELEIYRNKYGYLTRDDIMAHGGSNFSTRSIEGEDDVEKDLDLDQPASPQVDNGGGKIKETLKDFRMERTYLLGMKKMENGTLLTENEI
ncbi:hypothetical protein TSUD_209250 [Trifolium subterraneum]|uniref:GTD-binding domain-containing protein n=1 Tax=Trifolium subterraneum TaxID=3900 RepID=A0A2Z6NS94_TRISU|nr:hypothetical protein TSUD_209250 [Trifolium subterraneum]